jgi:hypothetical protein
MPPPFLERLAVELLGVFVLVLLILLGFVPEPAGDFELQAEQRADRRFDRAYLDRTQQHKQQHIDKLRLIHVARRLWIDRSRHVGRSFRQLSHAKCRVSAAP